jgi:hypothetical protein
MIVSLIVREMGDQALQEGRNQGGGLAVPISEVRMCRTRCADCKGANTDTEQQEL